MSGANYGPAFAESKSPCRKTNRDIHLWRSRHGGRCRSQFGDWRDRQRGALHHMELTVDARRRVSGARFGDSPSRSSRPIRAAGNDSSPSRSRTSTWEADDLIVTAIVAVFGLLIYAWRRLRELRREVTARRAAEGAAQRLARHDPLTGLPNRRYFNEKLDEALQCCVTAGSRVAVLMLDLDGFKAINDMRGHLVGDLALVEFAARIAKAAKGALVARVGGDEFAVVLPNIDSLDGPAGIARRITTSVAEPFMIAGTEVDARGRYRHFYRTQRRRYRRRPGAARRPRALSRQGEGRSLTRFFEPAMDAHVERRNVIERELRAAVADDQIEVALSAAGQPGRQPHHWFRGARALAKSGARSGRSQRLHRRRRGMRADQPARRSAAAHRLP